MKKFTNYQPGPRGINTDAGTVWLDPGQTVEIEASSIKGDIPDLGKAPATAEEEEAELASLKAEVDKLTKDLAAMTKDRDSLKAENDKLKTSTK